MKNLNLKTIAFLSLITAISLKPSLASPDGFSTGPIFKDHGENITIEGGLKQADQQHFKVVFDLYKENQSNKPHRGFNSIARFINMHVRAGVPIDNIDVALVVHGKASYDLMTDVAFAEKFSKKNPSSTLLTQLLENKVKIFVCGQSSSHLGLTKTLFNNNIEMSLSAMTANALLQQEGYTLNPF